jgi:RNA polymerase sigma-70 factor (ECF subfamily)
MPRDPQDKQTIEDLLARASAGDGHAWHEIVELYLPRVFGLIRVQCGDPELAEEITQSTFCTIAAKITSYTEVGRFESWLFRIAMNRLKDEMRRRKRQARPMEDQALVGLAGASEQDDAERADPDQLRALREAMTQLSDADQHIIHLRHSAGLSFREIAEVLDQPLGTVLARQHRALKKLRELMEQPHDPNPPPS